MTDEKFTKLSEEDLDLVVGGEYKDVKITRLKNGKYHVESLIDRSNEALHTMFLNKFLNGTLTDKDKLTPGADFGTSSKFLRAEFYDSYVEYCRKQGFTIHFGVEK